VRTTLRELTRDPYSVLLYDAHQRLVAIKRLALPYPDLDELERSFRRMEFAISSVPRRRSRLFVDARDSPARNDPAFEVIFARLQAQIVDGFSRTAVLVKSAAGVLQVGRVARGADLPLRVFNDVDEATRFLGVTLELAALPTE
jgi:hypothetical protein